MCCEQAFTKLMVLIFIQKYILHKHDLPATGELPLSQYSAVYDSYNARHFVIISNP